MILFLFFFFKQKTAYEMRISDWSSDVCSSDLRLTPYTRLNNKSDSVPDNKTILERKRELSHEYLKKIIPPARRHQLVNWNLETIPQFAFGKEIGRASCRERVCQYV